MDIERLTKTQIILLTLLVSFVTSIATGIVTVTLVDQAPPVVTQTINRVVERTVERVVPSDGQSASAGSGTTKVVTASEVKTIVVKESDLIIDAVNKVGKSVVRIYSLAAVNEKSESDIREAFLGLGFFISRDGLIATDSSLVAAGTSYAVVVPDGSVYEARVKNLSPSRETAIIGLLVPVAPEDTKGVVFPPVAFSNLAELKLGQSAIVLSGKERTMVATGIVSDFTSSGEGDGKAGVGNQVSTNIDSGGVAYGAPLVDLLGEVVGMYTASGKGTTGTVFISNTVIRAQLDEVLATTKKEV